MAYKEVKIKFKMAKCILNSAKIYYFKQKKYCGFRCTFNNCKLYYLSIIGKWNKTALIYAVKNGHSPVAAYLLRIGVDPCAADTSGNTPVHYAAAYGWLHCLKMLVKAGADPNAANQWKASIVDMNLVLQS